MITKKYENDIKDIQLEIQEKNTYILKILEESGKTEQDISNSAEKDETIKKLNERVEAYAGKLNKVLRAYNEIKDGEYDKSKPRHSFNTSSLSKARDLRKKNKTLLNETTTEEIDGQLTPRLSINLPTGKNSHSYKNIISEDDSVFGRLQRSSLITKSRTSIGPDYCLKPCQKWEQYINVEAHDGPISSMFLTENMLYTASYQKLKIWSLEKFSNIGEVSAHNALIRSMIF